MCHTGVEHRVMIFFLFYRPCLSEFQAIPGCCCVCGSISYLPSDFSKLDNCFAFTNRVHMGPPHPVHWADVAVRDTQTHTFLDLFHFCSRCDNNWNMCLSLLVLMTTMWRRPIKPNPHLLTGPPLCSPSRRPLTSLQCQPSRDQPPPPPPHHSCSFSQIAFHTFLSIPHPCPSCRH